MYFLRQLFQTIHKLFYIETSKDGSLKITIQRDNHLRVMQIHWILKYYRYCLAVGQKKQLLKTERYFLLYCLYHMQNMSILQAWLIPITIVYCLYHTIDSCYNYRYVFPQLNFCLSTTVFLLPVSCSLFSRWNMTCFSTQRYIHRQALSLKIGFKIESLT